MRQEDHPGFLGVTSKGVIAMHADWPIYPEEHGADLALLWLTAFPKSANFKFIDEIDQCTLFLADLKGSNIDDPYSDKNFNVAIWNEDLIGLHEKQLVYGIEEVFTEYEWRKFRWSQLPPGPYYIKRDDGTMAELPPLAWEYFDREMPYAARISQVGIVVSPSGRDQVRRFLRHREVQATRNLHVGFMPFRSFQGICRWR
jgi:hypothetical protein